MLCRIIILISVSLIFPVAANNSLFNLCENFNSCGYILNQLRVASKKYIVAWFGMAYACDRFSEVFKARKMRFSALMVRVSVWMYLLKWIVRQLVWKALKLLGMLIIFREAPPFLYLSAMRQHALVERTSSPIFSTNSQYIQCLKWLSRLLDGVRGERRRGSLCALLKH